MDEKWQDEYSSMMADCKKRSDKISEWDITFIESVEKQLNAGRVLSAKQLEKIDSIWERVTKNG